MEELHKTECWIHGCHNEAELNQDGTRTFYCNYHNNGGGYPNVCSWTNFECEEPNYKIGLCKKHYKEFIKQNQQPRIKRRKETIKSFFTKISLTNYLLIIIAFLLLLILITS